jgi:hypothetical protein
MQINPKIPKSNTWIKPHKIDRPVHPEINSTNAPRYNTAKITQQQLKISEFHKLIQYS